MGPLGPRGCGGYTKRNVTRDHFAAAALSLKFSGRTMRVVFETGKPTAARKSSSRVKISNVVGGAATVEVAGNDEELFFDMRGIEQI